MNTLSALLNFFSLSRPSNGSSSQEGFSYRREVDGLRALAVVPVVLFHAKFPLFAGGFVGVDIFFVISGYLITSILITDFAAGRYSVAQFYERRIRRILPALVFVILACLPLAWLWMLPSQMKNFSQSIVSSLLFSSNILFWLESGYFASDVDEKPLLHTWSLAVEEQFYIVFPILLFFLWRRSPRTTAISIWSVLLFSIALSEWGWRNDPTANFYLTPSRIWELLAGALTALWLRDRVVASHQALLAGTLRHFTINTFVRFNYPVPEFLYFGACRRHGFDSRFCTP